LPLLNISIIAIDVSTDPSTTNLSNNEENNKEKEDINKIKLYYMSGDTNPVSNTNENNQKNKVNMGKSYFNYFKIIIALLIVIVIIYAFFWFIKKFMKIQTKSDDGTIITTTNIGPGKSIVVSYVCGKYLVLGITNDSINLITEITDEKEIERLEILANNREKEEGKDFFDVMSNYFKKFLKKEPKQTKFDYEKDSVDFLKKQKDRIDKI